MVALAALAMSARAYSGAPVLCGATLSPEDALRRVNEARVHGATCPSAHALATAAPVRWSDSLASAAQVQAHEMALLRRMGHLDSGNRGLGERLRAQGYRFSSAVENVAVGYPSLDDVVVAWLESEGHCENLMNVSVLEVGVACVDDGTTGAPEERRYWTLVLGAPPRSR
jgi:uncharacterized protein YkwD